VGQITKQSLLGANVVASMLMCEAISRILMALFLNIARGTWNNVNNYIERGV
jgi:Na+/H+-translocating membrane pyrophosphatase